MSLSSTKKRFIAGAECPKCKTLDSIALTLENGIEELLMVFNQADKFSKNY